MNSFGKNFRITIFGESHSPLIGITVDGCPAGISISEQDFYEDLKRRKPLQFGTTERKEDDFPQIISGVFNGKTTGAAITVLFENKNVKSEDYSAEIIRPSHSDFVAKQKYFGFNDFRGGGIFSGRMTVGIVAAGNATAAAVYGIQMFNTNANITVLNKTESNAKKLAEKFNVQYFVSEQPTTKQISDFDLIIITIPSAAEYFKNVVFGKNTILFFADYTNRKYFKFLQEKNHRLILGEKWLVNQAVSAFEYFYRNDEFCRNVEISDETISSYLNNFQTANIFLTGFSGSGKTTIGKKLAEKLNRNFVDIDKIIENQNNKTVAEIFEINGEKYFRSQESLILEKICKEKNQIISLGGGAIQNPKNQVKTSSSEGFVVYIFSDLETSLSRIDINSRPILSERNSNEIKQLFEKRKSKYFKNSDLVILNSAKNPNEICKILFEEFK